MGPISLQEALQTGLDWQVETGAAVIHVVSVSEEFQDLAGRKLVVRADGEFRGELTNSLENGAINAGLDALGRRASRLYSLSPTDDGGTVVGMQGGTIDIFVEVLASPDNLLIVGAGHIAQPLAVIGGLLNWSVTVIDDRPDFANEERFPTADSILAMEFVAGLKSVSISERTFVVLVTRGHVYDADCLRYVLRTPAAYIGMIGSKMRIRTVLDTLRADGFSNDDLSRLYGPIGIDIGSHTPPEIAVAIAAEIIDVTRGGKSPHLALSRRD